MRLRQVSIGAAPGDVIVRGGRVLAVHTGDLLERDVVISGRTSLVGRFAADREIDAAGLHVVPTFVDSRLHIEYTMLTPGELGPLLVPKGTVSVLTDPDCLANVSGLAGMDFMRETRAPLRIFEQVTPMTPAFPHVEIGGAHIDENAVLERVTHSASVTLGESSPFDYGEVATNCYRLARCWPASASPGTPPARRVSRCEVTWPAAWATSTTRRPPTRCSSECPSWRCSRSWPA